MVTEYERVIEEANKLRKAVNSAQALRGVFIKYASIHAIITGIIAVVFIIGFYYLAIAPTAGDDEARIETVVREDAKALKALVCILSVPPNERTRADTKYCLKGSGVDFKDVPLPPTAGQYPPAEAARKLRHRNERRGTNNASNNTGGTKEPAPKPPPKEESKPEPRPTPKPSPLACVKVGGLEQCVGGN